VSETLRILVLNLRDISNPHAGGAEVHLHQIFSRMAARGCHVTLHCGGYPGARREEVIDGVHVVRRGGRLDNGARRLRQGRSLAGDGGFPGGAGGR